jgi:hypothetical protein
VKSRSNILGIHGVRQLDRVCVHIVETTRVDLAASTRDRSGVTSNSEATPAPKSVLCWIVKLLGCKLYADAVPVDLKPFSNALLTATAHPEVSLTIAKSRVIDARVLMYDSEVHTMSTAAGELHGALWLYLVHPAAVKVSYIKRAQHSTL